MGAVDGRPVLRPARRPAPGGHRASELARLAGVPHHPYILNGGLLANFERHLRGMTLLTDGHYLDQGIVMPRLPTYRELGIDFLLRGHGGELLHMTKAYSFSVDGAALRASDAELEAWLFRHLSAYMLDGVPRMSSRLMWLGSRASLCTQRSRKRAA